MARKKSRKRLIITLALVAVIGFSSYFKLVRSQAKVEVDPSRLVTVERGELSRSVVATGRIEPISKVEVKSKANGIIKTIDTRVGDTVIPGQILAELDKETLSAQLREARAGLSISEASLRGFLAQHEKDRVEAESPGVGFARRSLARSEQLYQAGLIPRQSYDESHNSLDEAENRQNVARKQLSVSEARIAQAEAEVAQAKAAVERAEEEVNNATIRSPIRGIVLSRDVEVGSPVSSILNLGSAATLVMVLGDISQVYVRGKVDESDIGVVRLGQPSRIKVETFKNREFEGAVTQISPLGADKDNVVTFEVRVSIDNPGGQLRTNMTANAEIVLERHDSDLIVPESAVIYDAQHEAWVDTPNPNSPKGRDRIPIKVGISNGTRAQVLDGLSEGQRIIIQ